MSACQTIDISLKTWKRWQKSDGDRRHTAIRKEPANKLTEEEISLILNICNQPKYASLPPTQIVPRLADEGVYLASESTIYRILRKHNQINHRGRSQAPKKIVKPTSYEATAPREVWSWDITWLPSKTQGHYYYLYMIEDIFSRKIVGYEVYEKECGEHASTLLQRTLLKEKCMYKGIVLHSDNGSPMKSFTFKAKMEELNIISSFSRPRVSDDNAYIESLFKTLKYCPQWPSSKFSSLDEAREWVHLFVKWYNNEHRHSAISFVTPSQRHDGLDIDILANRKKVYENARLSNPKRWSKNCRQWKRVESVMLNPDKPKNNKKEAA